MKKKLRFYILRYFILIVILFSLIKSTNFLKNIYFLKVYNYDSRISKNYNYCEDESVAFLHFLKSKYKLNKKVKIINYEIHPNPEWVFFNLNNDNIYRDKLILLNYEKEEKIKFIKLNNDLFTSHRKAPYFFKIEKAIFSINSDPNINKINLSIINRLEDYNKILFSKNFIFNNQSKEIDLNLDLEKFNIRVGTLYIKIKNNENNLEHIEDITLKLISKYNLDNFKIIEKVNNCYFLERLS